MVIQIDHQQFSYVVQLDCNNFSIKGIDLKVTDNNEQNFTAARNALRCK